MRARIAASSGQFALNREISVCAGLRGGAGRTRTTNQTIISGQLLASNRREYDLLRRRAAEAADAAMSS
jgi:hypothetical protein